MIKLHNPAPFRGTPATATWELTARGGDRDVEYPWGDAAPTCERVSKFEGGLGCGTDAVLPVCTRSAGDSLHGVCNLAGNVREMTADDFHPDYVGAPLDGSPWRAPAADAYMVRGAAWNNGPGFRFTVYRRSSAPVALTADFLGFRLARDIGP